MSHPTFELSWGWVGVVTIRSRSYRTVKKVVSVCLYVNKSVCEFPVYWDADVSKKIMFLKMNQLLRKEGKLQSDVSSYTSILSIECT